MRERTLQAEAAGVADGETKRSRLMAAAAMLGAVLSSSCCIIPLGLFLLGIGGSWTGALTSLAPWQPYFMVPTVGILAYGFWHVYGGRRVCADGQACARPLPNRVVEVALWSAAALIVAAFTFNWWAPRVLGLS